MGPTVWKGPGSIPGPNTSSLSASPAHPAFLVVVGFSWQVLSKVVSVVVGGASSYAAYRVGQQQANSAKEETTMVKQRNHTAPCACMLVSISVVADKSDYTEVFLACGVG